MIMNTKIICLCACLLSVVSPEIRADEEGVIDLLFLGHGRREVARATGHLSYKYAPMLNATFGEQKIRMSYEEDFGVLNAESLAQFDVVLLYANHKTGTAEEVQALVDFVEAGGGFMPIHCASACFQKSDDFLSLVGARFRRHGKGTFVAKIEDAFRESPIMAGFEAFETWDETYVHSGHGDDRDVLMTRDGEPWTWTRRQGKGRVFYTAYGHDERTWSNPPFLDLMLRGVLWTAGEDKAAANRKLVASLPKLKYGSTDYVQNYEKRAERLRKQEGLSPEDSQALSLVTKGFRLELFAAEPDIVNPVAFAWDERGRLFVVETVDYPNNVEGTGDRIVICEDTDGDWKADTFKEFASGLNIPTSIVRVNGGWLVSQQPSFIFLRDTDGDDVADVYEEQPALWGTGDTHAGPANLKYGFDNYVWGSVGYSGFKSEAFGSFGNALFRMKADASYVEEVALLSNNTWGVAFTEDFEIVGSTANGAPVWHVALPRRYADASKDVGAELSAEIQEFAEFFPITDKIRQVDNRGEYTAGSSIAPYAGRHFPKAYWNTAAFVGGPTGNLLGKFFLQKTGSSYRALNRDNIWASVDAWASPVFSETGPDGQLWVADWYNFIIQHNPVPTKARGGFDSTLGAGKAHENPLRDLRHGRIYRIVYGDTDQDFVMPDLSKATTAELVEHLGDDTLFWRMTAQRKLVEEGRYDAAPALEALVKSGEGTDEVGINGGAIHALWTLSGLGYFQQEEVAGARLFEAALRHPAASVRKNALMAYPSTAVRLQIMLESGVLGDKDPQVALKAFLALSESETSVAAGRQLHAVRTRIDPKDYWLAKGYALAVTKHADGFLDGLSETKAFVSMGTGKTELGYLLGRSFARRGEDANLRLLKGLEGLPSEDLGGFLRGVLAGWDPATRLPGSEEVALVNAMVGAIPESEQLELATIAERFKLNLDFSFDPAEYARYAEENAFKPDIWARGRAELGKGLYAKHCVGCHGADAEGSFANGSPSLGGMDNVYVQTQFQKFQQGLRGGHVDDQGGVQMAASLAFVSKGSVKNASKHRGNLAAYLESLPRKQQKAVLEGGNAARGASLYATCMACHGPEAEGNSELKAPALAYKDDWYLLGQLKKFKSGVRGYDPRDAHGTQMKAMTQVLSDEQAMKDVIAYIRSLAKE